MIFFNCLQVAHFAVYLLHWWNWTD